MSFIDELKGYLDGMTCDYYELDIMPVSTPRPRLGKYGVHNTTDYTNDKKSLSILLKKVKVQKREYKAINIICEYPYPKSTPKKHQIDGKLKDTKPDWDNLPKAVQDVITKSALLINKLGETGDDGQISIGSVIKRYRTGIETGKIKIWLYY